jgi:hypothetical protein
MTISSSAPVNMISGKRDKSCIQHGRLQTSAKNKLAHGVVFAVPVDVHFAGIF